jgi:hypothetical protein
MSDLAGGRVKVIRDKSGQVRGFQDPDTGQFISRKDAIARVSFDAEKAEITDSFGNPVGVGALRIPKAGVSVAFKAKQAEYKPIVVDPSSYTPGANEEIIERLVFLGTDGKLVVKDISYGLGTRYDPNKKGGAYRMRASEALGKEPGERLPTRDLDKALLSQEFMIKTITPKL